MSIENNTKFNIDFNSIKLFEDQQEAFFSVKAEKNESVENYEFNIVYNDKLVRKKFGLDKTDPILPIIRNILEKTDFTGLAKAANYVKGEKQDDQSFFAIKDIKILNGNQFQDLKKTEQKIVQYVMQNQLLSCAEEELDSIPFSMDEEFEKKAFQINKSPIQGLDVQQLNYLKKLRSKIIFIERSFKGLTLKERSKGAEEFTTLRKEFAMQLFNEVVCPQIQNIMKKYNDERPLDKILCIYGFNRLFTRDRASAGTDIDFMLVLDTPEQKIIEEIRTLIKDIKNELNTIGLDMEIADYLVIDLPSYQKKLGAIRSSLFTLANMFNPLKKGDNAVLITGSEDMLRNRVFSFTNEQLADHYTSLLLNASAIQEEEKDQIKLTLFNKLSKGDENFRNLVIDNLQRMAANELYIGKKPYSKKKTIQTIMQTDLTFEKRKERKADFSVKFCINRITDIIRSTSLPCPMSDQQFKHLESLGLLLCNAACYIESKEKAPVIMLESYADIDLNRIKQMSMNDRVLACYFLESFDIFISPFGETFAQDLYDGLWQLADKMFKVAQNLESSIYINAKALISQ